MQVQQAQQSQARDPFVDFRGVLTQFVSETIKQLPPDSEERKNLTKYRFKIDEIYNNNSREDTTLNLVKPVIKSFKSHSKDILFRNGCIFSSPLMMFDNSVDVARLWRKQSPESRHVMWEFIEQLYVIGNLVVYPNRKEKFLQLVSALKQQQQSIKELESMDEPEMDKSIHIENDGSNVEGDEETQQALKEINQMFGLTEGDVMTEMVGDIAGQVNNMLKNTENPEQLIQQMMRGDMSMFQGMMQNVGQKLEQKIESGEVDRNALEAQAQSMVGQFQGLSQQLGMGGMQGMGIPNMGGMQGMPQGMPPGMPQGMPQGMPPLDPNMMAQFQNMQNMQMPNSQNMSQPPTPNTKKSKKTKKNHKNNKNHKAKKSKK